jgi:hypothetical protein
MRAAEGTTLHIGWYRRATSMHAFQRFLLTGSVIDIAILVAAVRYHVPFDVRFLPGLVFPITWLLGASAYARVDGDGLRWRMWRSFRFEWSELAEIIIDKDTSQMSVRAHGTVRQIGPTVFLGADGHFMLAVKKLAEQNGVQVTFR